MDPRVVQRTYMIQTLGCKANSSESDWFEVELSARGWKKFRRGHDAEPDLVVVNSCTVTDEADRQSKSTVRKASQQFGSKTVVAATGCGVEVDPQSFLKQPGLKFIFGNQSKHQFNEWMDRFEAGFVSSYGDPETLGSVSTYDELVSRHPMDREWPTLEGEIPIALMESTGTRPRTRSFLKIQEGCNAFCTYCIIPYGRGPSRSYPISSVIAAINRLVQAGTREVVLTGTNIGDYGVDRTGKMQLVELLQSILSETDLLRLRLSSLDPIEIDDDLLEIVDQNPRICAHFHVSLQSPVSPVLKLMKRKYGSQDAEQCLSKIAQIRRDGRPAFVGMDLITGFPGESDALFEETLEKLARWSWHRLHVFPYSERSSTPATRLPNPVPPGVRTQRAKLLREMSMGRLKEHYRLHQPQVLDQVLVEAACRGPDGSRDWVAGYSPDYLRVVLRKSDQVSRNSVVPTRIDGLGVDSENHDVFYLGSFI